MPNGGGSIPNGRGSMPNGGGPMPNGGQGQSIFSNILKNFNLENIDTGDLLLLVLLFLLFREGEDEELLIALGLLLIL